MTGPGLVPGLQLICNLCNNEPLVTPRLAIFTGTQQTFPTTDHYCGGNFNSCALYIYCTCSAAGCWSNSLFWKTFSSLKYILENLLSSCVFWSILALANLACTTCSNVLLLILISTNLLLLVQQASGLTYLSPTMIN